MNNRHSQQEKVLVNISNTLRSATSALLLSATGLLCAFGAQAQSAAPTATPAGNPAIEPPIVAGGMNIDLAVPLFQSRVVRAIAKTARVSVANPDVADIVVISPTELYVLGKDLGTTNVLLWDSNSHLIGAIAVEVQQDLDSLKRKYAELLPGQAIEVRASQRSIILAGRVPDAETMNAAVRIAQTYLAQIQTSKDTTEFKQGTNSKREDKTVGEVINLIQVGGAQQVMLEVKVAEISRTELRRLDAQFNSMAKGLGNWNVGGVNGGATFPDALFGTDKLRVPVFGTKAPLGPSIDEFAPTAMAIQNQGLFASFLDNNFLFNLALDAAKEKGLARILAEPTLTTLSGQEASFLSGGEFPIPVPQGVNGTTITFKEFGISVRFIPVVLSDGHINIKLNVSVSELESGNSVALGVGNSSSTFVIPSLSKRSASGTVELSDGQTMGLAGLLHETTKSLVTKFPGLGDVPVLGALFRSQSYQKGETELVILVTPRLARALPPGKVKLPTDSYVEPSDAEFFLRGKQDGAGPKKSPATAPASK